MDTMMRSRRRYAAPAVLALTLAALLLAACGPNVIRGRPPFVTVPSLELDGDRLDAAFGVANQNDVPMTLSSADFAMTVRGEELVRYAQAVTLKIDANSREELRAGRDLEPFAGNLLRSLDSGQLASLPFDLAGTVDSVEDGRLRFEYTGYLYPVPGRPGQYRAAVTQARELRTEQPF